ncbi:hypothetical protein M23134_05810 [Microscilla marina ATCC 23134]|uniref:Uncharacterized protein n=1 Tax=Microscilla marina ATCC 23134 TaxID=313606 RepID=A1ZIR9_MICM2|nr:hypothetical protein M23134_05810 [Microscilla marina ATCC 23134]
MHWKKEETLTLFVDSRKVLNQLVKNYATYKRAPVQKIYQTVYK